MDNEEKLRELMRYILTHPNEQYGRDLLRSLFPESIVLENFGIKSSDVQKRIEELQAESEVK